MSEEVDSISFDEVSVISTGVPLGKYDVRLLDVEGRKGRENGKLSLVATLEIEDGPYAGLTIPKFYSLSTFKDKQGRTGCFGVSQIKADATNLDLMSKLPSSFPIGNVDEARKIYAKAFVGIRAVAVITEREYTDKNTQELKKSREVTLMPGKSAGKGTTVANYA